MSRRVASPLLIGRQAELALLDQALGRAEAGDSSTVVVAGDAGIGKSRLVAELCSRAESRGFLVLMGGCIELCEGGVPFGPVVEALRRLRDQVGAHGLAELLGTSVPELGALVPGVLGEDVPLTNDVAPQGRLLELVLGVVDHLAMARPVALVIEDLHWADRSTTDLVMFLQRNLSGRVLLVGTVRSDELHRRHPLRPVLAELERSASTSRLDLHSFTREELTEQVEAITGSTPHADVVDELMSRSEGNPFFAEELLAAAQDDPGVLPDTLRDILMSRFAHLPDDDQDVLRVAAALGVRFDDRLLREVSSLDDRTLDPVLRNLVEANLLQADTLSDGYCFRHALVQEAVYDELLPGERRRIHACIAETLAAEDTGGAIAAAALAHHWFRAKNLPLALAASVRAGVAAERVPAPAEAARHFERALELWEAVPDAAERSELSYTELLAHAAEQENHVGEFSRALAHTRMAIAEVDPEVDPVRAGVLHERLGRFLWTADQDGLPDHEEAVRLVPTDPPSAERARVLAGYAQILVLVGENGTALPVAEEAVAIARAVGARTAEAHALNTLGTALVSLGRVDDGLAALHESLVIAEEVWSVEDIGRVYVNTTHCLGQQGRWDELRAFALEGIARTRQFGLDRTWGVFVEANMLDALVAQGAWDEAEERTRSVISRLPVGYWEHFGVSTLWPDRGYFDLTRPIGRWLSALPEGAGVFQGLADQLSAWVALSVYEEHYDDARSAMEMGLERLPEDFLLWRGGELFWRGLWAEADRALAARARHDEAAVDDALRTADRWWLRLVELVDPPSGDHIVASPQLRAYVSVCRAERDRAGGVDDAAAWAEAVADLDAFELCFPGAYARYRLAEVLVRTSGDRAEAARVLAEARTTAADLRAAPLAAEIESLGRRARLAGPEATPVRGTDSTAGNGEQGDDGSTAGSGSAAADADAAVADLGLSPRELDVLRLVAEGATNRQIAEQLYISPKTASVHVSNILSKLGVASRGEAAAVAHRLGVVHQ